MRTRILCTQTPFLINSKQQYELHRLRESSFNMTGRWDEYIEGGGSEKIVGSGGGAPKICILQNQQEWGGESS